MNVDDFCIAFFCMLGSQLAMLVLVGLMLRIYRSGNLRASVVDLIERGASVEARGFHAYKSRRRGEYLLLDFNVPGLDYEEESFGTAGALADRFLEASCLE